MKKKQNWKNTKTIGLKNQISNCMGKQPKDSPFVRQLVASLEYLFVGKNDLFGEIICNFSVENFLLHGSSKMASKVWVQINTSQGTFFSPHQTLGRSFNA